MKNCFNYGFQRTGFIIFLFLYSQFFNAQEQKSEFWSHMQYGGGIGLSFGSGFFSGTIAPSAIYRVNNQFATGVGLSGSYSSEKNFYNSTIIGGSLIALFNVIQEIQFSAEFEELYVTRNFEDTTIYKDENYWYPAIFFGMGFETNNITIGIRYDVLYDRSKSVYANAYVPFMRVYF